MLVVLGIVYIFASVFCVSGLIVAFVEVDTKFRSRVVVSTVLLFQSVALPTMFYFNVWAGMSG